MAQADAHPKPKIPLPRALPAAAHKKVADAIEGHMAAIEALVAFLDEVADPDLEPSLGAPETYGFRGQEKWAVGGRDEREEDPCDGPIDDDELDGPDHPDAEHSLGWTGGMNQERALKQFSSNIDTNSDLEAEHDGREPCSEDEGAQCEDEGADEHAGLGAL